MNVLFVCSHLNVFAVAQKNITFSNCCVACERNFSLQLKQNLKSNILPSSCREQFWGEVLPHYEVRFSVIETDAHTVYWYFLTTL